MSIARETAMFQVAEERDRQDEKWGPIRDRDMPSLAVLVEEVGEVAEAMLEGRTSDMLVELIQVAAVAVSMVESSYLHGGRYGGDYLNCNTSVWDTDLIPPRHPLSERFHEILREAGELHDKKQQDYGRANDPFANVRGSEEWGVRPWKGAMVRANDKIKRLQKFAQDGQLANESARDSFMDLAVYVIIALVLFEEDDAHN